MALRSLLIVLNKIKSKISYAFELRCWYLHLELCRVSADDDGHLKHSVEKMMFVSLNLHGPSLQAGDFPYLDLCY